MVESKAIFIIDIPELPSVQSCFSVVEKQIKTASNGKNYLEMILGDKTGVIKARKFGAYSDTKDEANHFTKELFEKIGIGEVFLVNAKVDEFPKNSGKYNLNIQKMTKADEFNSDDFIPESEANKPELIKYIKDQSFFIKDECLNGLFCTFIKSECWKDFTEKPAAKGMHHNYASGLLEHTANVMKICGMMVTCYHDINKELLITGALLHDIGKIKTYQLDMTGITVTKQGELFDHIYISTQILEQLINDFEKESDKKFPRSYHEELIHMILSHHGNVENGWGSSVDPRTPEAVVLHHADNLDAKAKGMLQEVKDIS